MQIRYKPVYKPTVKIIPRCPYCLIVMTNRNRTEDHLIPRVVQKHGNTITCCRKCNNDRGKVAGFYGEQLKLKNQIENYSLLTEKRQHYVRRLIKRIPNILKKLDVELTKWLEIEEKRLGRTYSDCMDFTLLRSWAGKSIEEIIESVKLVK